jgi:hypothetical protein
MPKKLRLINLGCPQNIISQPYILTLTNYLVMEKFINILLWFVGSFLCLLAILGFVNGDFLVPAILLVIGLLLLPPIYKKIKEK